MTAWFSENIAWMYWTFPSAIFVGGIFAAIIGMTIWDHFSPNVNRKGFLPIATSRGDRLFIGIISIITIHLLWLAFFSGWFLWGAVIISVVWCFVMARWG